MTTIKVIGFAGTGKTSYLVNRVDKLFDKGVQPYEIGFYTFTRAAAKEAIDRALSKSPRFQRQDFAHFRTIHSEAARLLELREEEVFVTDERLREFCKSIGYRYQSKVDPDNPYDWITSRYESPQVFWGIRSFGVHNRYTASEAWGHYPNLRYVKSPRISEYKAFLDKYSEYKNNNGLFDYDDLLINVLQEKKRPNIKYLIVDEFQDLSPLLYQIFLQWEESMEEVIIAGDPYQAIYTFMGAEPRFLQDHPSDKRVVLPQSHRLPSNILTFAQKFINDPDFQTVTPTQQKGKVKKEFGKSFDLGGQLRQENGSVFLLTRTNYHLRQLMEELIAEGIPFSTYRGYSLWDRKTCVLHNALLNFSTNKPLSLYETKVLLAHFPVKGFLVHGAKAKINKAIKEKASCDLCFPDSQEVDPEKLKKVFLQNPTFSHLIHSLKLGKWHKTALKEKIDRSRERIDYQQLLIKVGTIHSVKGREADTVFLFTDITKRIRLWADVKEEQRIWFVGMTRVRQKLVIVENRFNKKTRNNYHIPVPPQKPSDSSETSPEEVKPLKLPTISEIPITPDFWKDHILKVVEDSEKGINREDLREKIRKSIGLGIGYYNRLDKLIDELLQEGILFEPPTGYIQLSPESDLDSETFDYDSLPVPEGFLHWIGRRSTRLGEPVSVVSAHLWLAKKYQLSDNDVETVINECLRQGLIFEPRLNQLLPVGE